MTVGSLKYRGINPDLEPFDVAEAEAPAGGEPAKQPWYYEEDIDITGLFEPANNDVDTGPMALPSIAAKKAPELQICNELRELSPEDLPDLQMIEKWTEAIEHNLKNAESHAERNALEDARHTLDILSEHCRR